MISCLFFVEDSLNGQLRAGKYASEDSASDTSAQLDMLVTTG